MNAHGGAAAAIGGLPAMPAGARPPPDGSRTGQPPPEGGRPAGETAGTATPPYGAARPRGLGAAAITGGLPGDGMAPAAPAAGRPAIAASTAAGPATGAARPKPPGDSGAAPPAWPPATCCCSLS